MTALTAPAPATPSIRSYLKGRARLGNRLLFGALYTLIAAAAASSQLHTRWITAAAGVLTVAIVAAGITGFFVLARLKCPKCRKQLSTSATAYNFCPYCGVNVDEHMSH
jgi:hypothetical protein